MMAFFSRYFPTQALNFAFKEALREVSFLKVSKTNPSQVEKLSKYILSGGMAGSLSLSFVYSLDYARTR